MFDEGILNHIRKHLLDYSQTIAVAESVTAGFIQAFLSQPQNASGYFQGGITVYNLAQKYKFLKVEPINAQKDECVNDKVARQMCIEVANIFTSDYGCAITGFATKVPEQNINELYAFIAISFRGKIIVCERVDGSNEGMECQLHYANELLDILSKNLQNENEKEN